MRKNTAATDGRAKPSRMQVFRMARIVSMLKKNRMPSAEDILREYEKLEFEENQLIRAKYSIRTVFRDVDSLKGISIYPRPAAAVNNDGDIRGVFLEK